MTRKLQGNQRACVLVYTAPWCRPCPSTYCPCHILPIPMHTVPAQTFTCHVLSHVTYHPPVHTAPAVILLQGSRQYINCLHHCLSSGTLGLAFISTPHPSPCEDEVRSMRSGNFSSQLQSVGCLCCRWWRRSPPSLMEEQGSSQHYPSGF